MFTVTDLHNAFMELDTRARHEGKIIDIAVYGGSALMLASNFRVTTQDVDAVAEESQETLTRLAEEVARLRTLLRAYPSEQGPGLRVFVPSAEYMLAMKLMAMRIDPTGDKSDIADILNLLEVVGFKTENDLIDFAARFYPEAKISARLHLGIRELWRAKDNLTQEGRHATPSYLGRGRPSPQRG
jgi:hypothetical protein